MLSIQGIQGEEFPLNILLAKQDRISLNCIIFEGFQGASPPEYLVIINRPGGRFFIHINRGHEIKE